MLGDQIGTITCTTTNKPLATEGALPKFETTAEGAGTLAGAQVQSIATYASQMRADGTLYGECPNPVSYTHLRAHETRGNLVCRLLLEKKS